jgi:hypothetical protein
MLELPVLFEEVLQDLCGGEEGAVASDILGYPEGFDDFFCGSEFEGSSTQGCGALQCAVLHVDGQGYQHLELLRQDPFRKDKIL